MPWRGLPLVGLLLLIAAISPALTVSAGSAGSATGTTIRPGAVPLVAVRAASAPAAAATPEPMSAPLALTAPPAASLHVAPTQLAPGGRLEVLARELGREELLSVWLTDPAGAVSAEPDRETSPRGEIGFFVTLPPAARPGRWSLTVQGQATGRRAVAAFTVDAPNQSPVASRQSPVTTPSIDETPASAPAPEAAAATPMLTPTPDPSPQAPAPTATPTATKRPNRDIAHLLPPAAPGGPVAPRLARTYFGAAARAAGVPVEILLAIAAVESGFNPTAVGPYLPQYAGTENEHALGMMQFLPGTYRPYARLADRVTGKNLGLRGLWDPESAVYAAAFYLRDAGAQRDLEKALFRYNNAEWYVRLVLAWSEYYANGGTNGYAPVLDRARLASLPDPSARHVQAATAGPGQAQGSHGDNAHLALLDLLALAQPFPSWPPFRGEPRILPH